MTSKYDHLDWQNPSFTERIYLGIFQHRKGKIANISFVIIHFIISFKYSEKIQIQPCFTPVFDENMPVAPSVLLTLNKFILFKKKSCLQTIFY